MLTFSVNSQYANQSVTKEQVGILLLLMGKEFQTESNVEKILEGCNVRENDEGEQVTSLNDVDRALKEHFPE